MVEFLKLFLLPVYVIRAIRQARFEAWVSDLE